MKKSFLQLTVIKSTLILIMQSCNNYGSEINIINAQEGIAIEATYHFIYSEQSEFLKINEHKDFLSTDIINIIRNDPFLNARSKAQCEQSDTVFTLSEIPIKTEQRYQSRIFHNGHSETIFEDLTGEGSNPIYYLIENAVDESTQIRKTIIKEGVLTAFNSSGNEVIRSAFEEPDMREFLDTLFIYLDKLQREGNGSTLNKMNQFRFSLNKLYELVTFSKLPNANISMELIENKDFTGNSSTSSMYKWHNTRSITELDPEMTKTLRYELYAGNQLIGRSIYSYSPDDNFRGTYNGKIVSEHPEIIKTQIISFNPEGKPMLRTTTITYLKNQIIYHSNQTN